MLSAEALEMRQVTGPQVCLTLGLALILAGSVVGLAAMGKDVVTILAGLAAVAITVGGAFAAAKANQLTRDLTAVNQNVDHVKELSNGRLTDLLEDNKQLNAKLQEVLMLMPPPPQLALPPGEQKAIDP